MRQYITCRVARQDFALDATRIRGLLPVHEMTPFHATPECICGVASIRGHDFPVVDLRRRMAIPAGAIGRQPCIVAVEIRGARLLGFIADRVSEVIGIRAVDVRRDHVRVTGRARRLLEPDRILTDENLENFRGPRRPICRQVWETRAEACATIRINSLQSSTWLQSLLKNSISAAPYGHGSTSPSAGSRV